MKVEVSLPRRIVAVILCCLPFAVIAGTAIAWWPLTTSEIPTQWANGEVSTTAPVWTVLLLPACGSFVCAVVAVLATSDPDPSSLRWTYFWTGGIATMLAAVWFVIIMPHVLGGAGDTAPAWLISAPLLILLGLVPWAITGRGTRSNPVEATPLGDLTERTTWVGASKSPVLLTISIAVGGGSLIYGLTSMARATDAIAVITVVVGVLILGAGFALGWIVVVADQRGLRVRGSIGVPLKSIPADSIREVSVVELSALRWGGWGYRVSPQGAAVVTRTGPLYASKPTAHAFSSQLPGQMTPCRS